MVCIVAVYVAIWGEFVFAGRIGHFVIVVVIVVIQAIIEIGSIVSKPVAVEFVAILVIDAAPSVRSRGLSRCGASGLRK